MNVLIGWILLLITMSVFITFVFGYDLDLKDKIICIVGTDTFVILLAVALVKMMEDRGVDICEITVNEKILYDEYMRGYRKGYREGRDVIVGIFDDKMKELKNEIAEEAVR